MECVSTKWKQNQLWGAVLCWSCAYSWHAKSWVWSSWLHLTVSRFLRCTSLLSQTFKIKCAEGSVSEFLRWPLQNLLCRQLSCKWCCLILVLRWRNYVCFCPTLFFHTISAALSVCEHICWSKGDSPVREERQKFSRKGWLAALWARVWNHTAFNTWVQSLCGPLTKDVYLQCLLSPCLLL